MTFYCHENKSPFHKKGLALSLVLKVKIFGTCKWPIVKAAPFDTCTTTRGNSGTHVTQENACIVGCCKEIAIHSLQPRRQHEYSSLRNHNVSLLCNLIFLSS